MSRKAIGKKIRFEVLKRDSFKCQYCGASAPDVILHIDHIQPISKGGDNDITNLITSCIDCNFGKGAVELDDNAAIIKRKEQLDEINERREQLEMMLDWHRSLAGIENQEVDAAAQLWDELVPNWYANETGKKTLKKLISKFGLNEVLECMRISVSQYLVIVDDKATDSSVQKTFEFIGKIATNRKRHSDKPYLKDMYYARGILNNRLHYVNSWMAIELMEKAHFLGYDTQDMIEIAKDVTNWTEWRDHMEGFIYGKKATT